MKTKIALRLFDNSKRIIVMSFGLMCYSIRLFASSYEEFANKFKCNNPVLQWQSENTISIHQLNDVARESSAKKSSRSIQADQVYCDPLFKDKCLLYRGVTNKQFDEGQILRLVFNDSTSVSESRWFTSKLYPGAEEYDLVKARESFKRLPFDEQVTQFKKSFLSVKEQIEKLLSADGGNEKMAGFDEHISIRSHYNSKPVAIQFLTPHRHYAEFYGEFVLTIQEVIRRGIDVERYNYHRMVYTIGSIYTHDRDEYLVPSHIPSWDVQSASIRHGTSGWHRGNYGKTDYIFNKMYAEKNPCNTYGVRVDVQTSSGIQPIGVILKCESKMCVSDWDIKNLDSKELTYLKRVVESTKVDDKQLYFTPIEVLLTKDPSNFKNFTLSYINKYWNKIARKEKENFGLWDDLITQKGFSDFESLTNILKHFEDENVSIKAKLFQSTEKKFAAMIKKGEIDLIESRAQFSFFIAFWRLIYKNNDELLLDYLGKLSKNSNLRSVVIAFLSEYKPDKKLKKQYESEMTKLLKLENLTPKESLNILLSSFNSESDQNNTPLDSKKLNDFVQIVRNALKNDHEEIISIFMETKKIREGTKALIIDSAYDVNKNETFKVSPSFFCRNLKNVNSEIKSTLIGICIDKSIALKLLTTSKLLELVTKTGLPNDRELDTIRSVWSYLKDRSSYEGENPYEIFFNKFQDLYKVLMNNSPIEEKNSIKKAFIDFYLEFVTPPDRAYSVFALMVIAEINKSSKSILIPENDTIIIEDGFKGLMVSKNEIKLSLYAGLSFKYLQLLKAISEEAKMNDDFLTHVYLTIKEVLRGYIHFILTNQPLIESDLFLNEANMRSVMSTEENIVYLLRVLERVASKQDASKIKMLVEKLEPKLHFNSEISKKFVADPFWKHFILSE